MQPESSISAANPLPPRNKKAPGTGRLEQNDREIFRLLRAEDRVLGGLSHAELNDLLGGDLDLSAGGRIAADTALRFTNTSLPTPGKVKVFLAFL